MPLICRAYVNAFKMIVAVACEYYRYKSCSKSMCAGTAIDTRYKDVQEKPYDR